jgi:CBS domain-containing protein
MLRARDIMTKEVVNVKKTIPIYEAVEILTKHNVSGIPVVEDDMTLVGVLSEKDVVVLFYADEDGTGKTVEDYMNQPPVYFDENENLVEVCDLLAKNIFRRVPVTSEGKLVGIISVKDILTYTLQSKQAGQIP